MREGLNARRPQRLELAPTRGEQLGGLIAGQASPLLHYVDLGDL
jgi:hypothetical protein